MVRLRTWLPDGTVIDDPLTNQHIRLLSSFEDTISWFPQQSFKRQARNAVDDPLRAIQGFLYACHDRPAVSTTNALSGRTVHAPMELIIVLQALERAYLAHIEDYEAMNCPTPWSMPMRKLLRNVSYNWLGFMWQPGLGHGPFQVTSFMYSS